MPTVSDPGHVLIDSAIENDVPFTVVSGACAAVDALVLSGLAEHAASNGFVKLGHFAAHRAPPRAERLIKKLEIGLDIVYRASTSARPSTGLLPSLDRARILRSCRTRACPSFPTPAAKCAGSCGKRTSLTRYCPVQTHFSARSYVIARGSRAERIFPHGRALDENDVFPPLFVRFSVRDITLRLSSR